MEDLFDCNVVVESNPTYGVVILRFERPVTWLVLNKRSARSLLEPLKDALDRLGEQDIFPAVPTSSDELPTTGAVYTVQEGEFRIDFDYKYGWVRLDLPNLKALIDAITQYVNDTKVRHLKAVKA